MVRRFCLRLSRVIPSFQNCHSKDDAGIADTTPAFRLSPLNHKALDIDFPLPPSPTAPAFLRCHPPIVSAMCGCCPTHRGGHFSVVVISPTSELTPRPTAFLLHEKSRRTSAERRRSGASSPTPLAAAAAVTVSLPLPAEISTSMIMGTSSRWQRWCGRGKGRQSATAGNDERRREDRHDPMRG